MQEAWLNRLCLDSELTTPAFFSNNPLILSIWRHTAKVTDYAHDMAGSIKGSRMNKSFIPHHTRSLGLCTMKGNSLGNGDITCKRYQTFKEELCHCFLLWDINLRNITLTKVETPFANATTGSSGYEGLQTRAESVRSFHTEVVHEVPFDSLILREKNLAHPV